MTTASLERRCPTPERPELHRDRTKSILQQHPEIRALIGNNPWTFVCILGLALVQFAAAVALNDQPWWLVASVAFTAGVFPSLGLYFLIHECSHQLVFRRRSQNLLAGIIANLVNVAPYAITYQFYHHRHHSYLGNRDDDPDMPRKWEAQLIGTSPLFKFLWLLLNPFFLISRSFGVSKARIPRYWIALNFLLVIGFDIAVVQWIGPKAFAYLFMASFFAMGLPLGAFWIPEHYITDKSQETCSYYGWLNWVLFNRGFHNEHHDFPSVPWSRLPRIRKLAPDWYETLDAHATYLAALSRFVFDRRLSLFSRVEHRS